MSQKQIFTEEEQRQEDIDKTYEQYLAWRRFRKMRGRPAAKGLIYPTHKVLSKHLPLRPLSEHVPDKRNKHRRGKGKKGIEAEHKKIIHKLFT